VVGWLKTLAREVGPDGITVNTIAPGLIGTERLRSLYGPDGPPAAALERVPARRTGTPAEIAATVCFLASEQAAFVNGVVVPVDGGMLNGLS
jgi:NAD(P)-dependent dehydrogenase (short-subunit alcohol dehydrogenase family)